MILSSSSTKDKEKASLAEGRRRGFVHLCILFLLLRTVSVGYEYESCPDLILWEKRTAVLQGYEIDASKLGGWSLDKHHALNIQSGEWNKGIPSGRLGLGWDLVSYLLILQTKNAHFE